MGEHTNDLRTVRLLTDVWWHTIVPTKRKERSGYSTQKRGLSRLFWALGRNSQPKHATGADHPIVGSPGSGNPDWGRHGDCGTSQTVESFCHDKNKQ